MKCRHCEGESLSKISPLVDGVAGAAMGAATGSMFPLVGTVIGGIWGAAALLQKHPTLQTYYRCNACGTRN